jgi:predicted outer membrane repeat protein
MRSTLTGVFTAEQATRGGVIYATTCRSCHSGQTHSVSFKTTWSGHALWKLYDYIRHKMPRDDPGSLTHEEYTAVLAYLLRLNGMPVGWTALPADAPTLKSIRFDTLRSTEGDVAR